MPNKKTTNPKDPVYLELIKPLPKEANRKMQLDNGKEIDIHKYQFVANRLNEVLGIAGWSLERTTKPFIEQKNGLYYATVEVKLSISTASHSSYGSGIDEIRANAIKGAITNGFKKAAALFGIGKEYYEKDYEEEYDILPQELVNQEKKIQKLTEKDLENTKEIEAKLIEVNSADDLVKAYKEYKAKKDNLNDRQRKYLENIISKLKKKYQ